MTTTSSPGKSNTADEIEKFKRVQSDFQKYHDFNPANDDKSYLDQGVVMPMTKVSRIIRPYWQNRRILSMGLQTSSNFYEWEIFLDCQHSIFESIPKTDVRGSPTGLYRDCPVCKSATIVPSGAAHSQRFQATLPSVE